MVWGALRGSPNILLHLPPRPVYGAAQVISNLALGASLGLLVVFLTRVLQDRYAWARTLHNEFRHLLGTLDGREILLLALASAIGEECFFRGALQAHLEASLGAVPGIVVASGLFALLHIGPGVRFLTWTLSSFVVGLLLGAVFAAGGDLVAPIALHFTVNLLNLHDIVRRKLDG